MPPASPIRLVESGPAAGALAGSWFARRLGEDRLLCFDMGGTTAKSCLIERRRARAHEHVRGRPHLPLQEGLGLPGVGAVGRPRRDRRRRRQPRPRRRARPAEGRPRVVRRRSRPGELRPRRHASRRSPMPTSLLGLLDAGYFLGGDMPLDASRADDAACEPSPTRSACPSTTPRRACTSVVNQNMAAASRMHAVEQGVDLRGVTLLAFGGAGPVHACGVAELLESPRVDLPGQRQRARRRSARSCRRCASTSPARWCARSTASTTASATPCSTSCATEGRRVLAGRGRARRRRALPLRRSTPGTSARATRSPSGSATATDVWPATAASVVERVRDGVPAHLRPDDPRRQPSRPSRGACRRIAGRRAGRAGAPTGRRRHGRPRPPAGRASTAASRRATSPVYRRDDARRAAHAFDGPGDRRGARDDRRHPPGLARRGRRRRLARSHTSRRMQP